jgi:hypothetical protein
VRWGRAALAFAAVMSSAAAVQALTVQIVAVIPRQIC